MVSSLVAKACLPQRHCFLVLFYELEALFFTVNVIYPVHSPRGFSEVLS